MARFLVSVCRTDTCTSRGADALYTEFLTQVEHQGLSEQVTVRRGGCYGLCKMGPNVIVRTGEAARAVENDPFGADCTYWGRPGEVHYAALEIHEVTRVVAEHLGEGQPVSEFLDRDPRRVEAS